MPAFRIPSRALWVDFKIAFRNVFRQRRRTLLGLVAISFGVVALVLAAGFSEWIYWAMRESTIRSRLGHVQISRPGYNESGTADPFRYLLPDRSDEFGAVERLPGVTAVAPRLMLSGLASFGDATVSFIAEGVDPTKERGLSESVVIVAGAPLSADDPRGFILGKGLADNLGVKVGDSLVLLANTASGGINGVEGKVRGVFTTPVKAYDDSALRLVLSTAQALLRTKGAHVWSVLLTDTRQTPQTLVQLRSSLDSQRFAVVPWYELADFYNKTVDLFSRQIGVIRIIIGVIIVLSISNTLMMGVIERTSEIGTSLALGVTRAQMLRRFAFEGLVLGLVGGTIGVCLGLALGQLISAIGIPMPAAPGMAQGYVGAIRVTPGILADAFALAVVTTTVAGLYPAWQAARMVIVDALRHSR